MRSGAQDAVGVQDDGLSRLSRLQACPCCQSANLQRCTVRSHMFVNKAKYVLKNMECGSVACQPLSDLSEILMAKNISMICLRPTHFDCVDRYSDSCVC